MFEAYSEGTDLHIHRKCQFFQQDFVRIFPLKSFFKIKRRLHTEELYIFNASIIFDDF